MNKIISIANMTIGIILLVYGVYCVISNIDWRKERNPTYEEKYDYIFQLIYKYNDYQTEIQLDLDRRLKLFDNYLIAPNKNVEKKLCIEDNRLEERINKNTQLSEFIEKEIQDKIMETRDFKFMEYLTKTPYSYFIVELVDNKHIKIVQK